MSKRLEEFLKQAHQNGLSDDELTVLGELVSAAYDFALTMNHCADANNFNGRMVRAAFAAREAFGMPSADNPHVHCYWQCVARSGLERCEKSKIPTVHCVCGILSPRSYGYCPSCKQAFAGITADTITAANITDDQIKDARFLDLIGEIVCDIALTSRGSTREYYRGLCARALNEAKKGAV